MELDGVVKPLLGGIYSLPYELIIQCVSHLPLAELLRFSLTASHFHHITTSDDALTPILKAIIPSHSHPYIKLSSSSVYETLKFVWPYLNKVGYSLSSIPYISRVITVEISYERSIDSPSYDLTLTGSQLLISNALSNPNATPDPIELPFNALLSRSGTSYYVGRESASPDAGLSVDLLQPRYQFSPLFTITSSLATLAMSAEGLRLQLKSIERKVLTEDEERDPPSAADRLRRDADAMYQLFTGRRSTRRQWPTRALIGLSSVGDSESGRRIGPLRPAGGRPREAQSIRTVQHRMIPLEEDETDQDQFKEETFINGFHILLSRTIYEPSFIPGTFPTTSQAHGGEPRRPTNGGPAVMFQNAVAAQVERGAVDPDMVLRVSNAIGEEIVRKDDEQFFPLIAPSSPIQFDAEPTIDQNGEILAKNLEGLWAGSYGPHGIEICHISIKLTRIEEDSALGDELIPLAAPSVSGYSMNDTELRAGRYKRNIEAIKVTGDHNVPSGEPTWIGSLPDIDLEEIHGQVKCELGCVPSVRNEELLRWAIPGTMGARWEQGVIAGAGRVAAAGYVSPSWTSAVISFIRSTILLSSTTIVDGQEVGIEKEIDVVEEIRLSWGEMGKVSVFKRMRI